MRRRLLLPLLVFIPGVLVAQRTTLVVDVGDDATGAFIQDALIRIPQLGRVARTNWQGEARVANLEPGDYRVQVTKVGFAPSEVVMRIAGDTASAFFSLQRLASQLDTVRVYATQYTTQMQELDLHRRLGIARIVGESALAKARSQSLPVFLVGHLPVMLLPIGTTGWTVGSPVPATGTRRSLGGTNPWPGCDIYLDGMPFHDDLETLHPDELLAVEYYTDINAPVKYRAGGVGPCVLLLWSKW